MRRARKMLAAALVAIGAPGWGVAPASASVLPVAADVAQCILRPGVYAILDATTDDLVGVLIIYPDCRVEIIPAD